MRLTGIWSARRGGSDRRREPRRAVPDLSVACTALDVEMIDASGSGLGITAERPLRIGVVYPFRLSREGKVSEVYALVRWCEEQSAERFRTGLSVGKTVGLPLSRLAL